MHNEAIIVPTLPDPRPSFHPHARVTGGFVYVSGLIARTLSGDIPGVALGPEGEVTAYDIAIQTRQIFSNLEKILAASGSSLENVIDVTVFLTDIGKDFSEFNRIYGEIFGDIQPCRTTVEVTRFPSPVQIEVKVIAIVKP